MKYVAIFFIVLIAVVLIAGGVYLFWIKNQQDNPVSPQNNNQANSLKEIIKEITQAGVGLASEFATYEEVPVNYQPRSCKYHA